MEYMEEGYTDEGLSPTSRQQTISETAISRHVKQKGHHYGKSLTTTERGQGRDSKAIVLQLMVSLTTSRMMD
jgi:hypothetical protein